MRVTQGLISSASLRGLQAALGRVQDVQGQLSSGRRIGVPSDDPSGAAASMTLRSQRAADVQYLRNIDAAAARLNVTDNTLTAISDRLRGVRVLMAQANSGAISAESRLALSEQVKALKAEIVGLYNTSYLDRPVFGGSAPVALAVDPVTGAYAGDDLPVETRITRDSTIRVDVAGTAAGADLVAPLLDRIAANLAAPGPVPPVDVDDLDAVASKVVQALGEVGARQSRIESAKANVDSERLDLTARISDNEEIDLPETIMKLQSQQVAYQSALGASAKILQTSLLDYLR